MNFKLETSEDLEKVFDLELSNAYGRIAELLLTSMNDWPTQNLTNIEEFINEVSGVFGTPITVAKLKSKKFNGLNSWELESAASLIELLNLSKAELEITDLREMYTELLNYFEHAYSNTDFIAELKYKTTEDGGRSTPAFSKYRPQIKFEFEYMQTSGEQTFLNKEQVFPGESVTAKIRILGVELFKHRLETEMNFEFREGSRVIGTGKISEILNEELIKPAGNICYE